MSALSDTHPTANNDPVFGGAGPVTKSDTVDAISGHICRGLMVGTAGDVRLLMADGTDVVWPSVMAGVLHPFVFTRIMSTGTTAITFAVGKRA